MSSLREKAERLLKKCTECSVSAVTADGYPRVCLLVPLKTEGIKRFWFSTATGSRKVADYKRCNNAGVTFYADGNSVTLLGHMAVVDSKVEKDALWQDWMCKHFPNGFNEDPEYCVLRFEAHEATVYIDEEFETFPI